MVFGALLAPPAFGASLSLGGSPLNVIVGDQGQLQAFRTDRADPSQPPGVFYHPRIELGDAGFFLAVPGVAPKVWGFDGSAVALSGLTAYTAAGQDAVTGSGTAASPPNQVDAA